MSLRMVALKPTFQKVVRIARDTIQELNKNVEFTTEGENTEIDRAVAEKLLDPLVHMIKNAISHGIEENAEDRAKSGKDLRAKVELRAYSKRGKIFIEVTDDGRGINTDIVYKKAIEKGLIDPNKTYSEAEIKEFIMLPGFSTAKVVDNISGRGVGMDVVKTQILKIGGKVEIQSTLNKGSTFTLEVPVNHAIMNGTIIEMNEQQFVVPTVNVKEFLQPENEQWIFTQQKRTMIKVREHIIPIVPLSTFFNNVKEPDHVPLVMILELDQELRAIPITNVINRQEVVVKPVGIEFSKLKYISGMSILGTGKVSLILDIDYLFKKEVEE
ncbi:MAG: chemotaxis protein CheW [Candidatus Gastranaerophilales bacterium]|nr:chemotaxis protein CheW [Candidatus Gastranaerophilales bacterium]